MDSDVKISPMGYWVISLYKSNKINDTISLKTFDGLNEDVLKPENVQIEFMKNAWFIHRDIMNGN